MFKGDEGLAITGVPGGGGKFNNAGSGPDGVPCAQTFPKGKRKSTVKYKIYETLFFIALGKKLVFLIISIDGQQPYKKCQKAKFHVFIISTGQNASN